MDEIQKYLYYEPRDSIDVSTFSQNRNMSDEHILGEIKKFIANQIEEILLVEIKEDKILSPKRHKQLPSQIRNLLRYSEYRGIKLYVFKTKDGTSRTAISVFGGSTGRANEYYFGKIFNDPDYQQIVKIVSISLSDILLHKR